MKVKKNLNLESYNSYKIKGLCKIAYFPETIQELTELTNNLEDYIIIGGGYNIILSLESYTTPFIFLRENLHKTIIQQNEVYVEAGQSMWNLSNQLLDNSLKGFEVFCDIPGCIGGGIVMNAGANETFISNFVTEVSAIDTITSKIVTYTKSECEFGYRDSIFKKRNSLIVVSAKFDFPFGDKSEIKSNMEIIKQQRAAKQPKDFPNAGSVFKRPKGFFVGTMIESLGLKGFSIGDAQISEKHAGFIVNKGNATGKQILELISLIQTRIKAQFGIDLELEQIVI